MPPAAQVVKPKPKPKGSLNQSLKEWRKTAADELQKPVYFVLSNKVLDEIASRRPLDLAALEKVPGIGPAKLLKFGRLIIDIVQSHSGDVDVEVSEWGSCNYIR